MNVLREHAEEQYREELEELKRQDSDLKPTNWNLSPQMVIKYLMGGKLKNGFIVSPKYIGNQRLMEIAVATLTTDRALLLYGIPGTAKSWVSEHLAAAITGDSTLLIQGTAGTSEESIRYGWNYARLLAEGPSEAAMVSTPVMKAMQTGKIVRIEELTRISADVQDSLITMTKALKTFEEAREFSSSSGSMPLRINSHLNLSDVYQALGDYGKALDHIEQCITLCAENKDSVKLTNAINAYAILYSNCQLFDEAQQLFDIELKYSKHFSPYMEFNYYNSKGRMFYLKEDFVRAKKEFLNGLAVVPRDDSYANMIILSNLAETYLLLNNPDSAKVYLDKVSEIGIGLSTMPIFNFNYHSLLGNFYWQKTEFEKAKKAFEKADMIATQIDVDKVLRKLHIQRKTKFYISTKNYQQASLLLQDFVKLNDLILQEDNLKLVAGLKYKFERDATIINQRSELALKEQELKSYRFQRTILVVGIFVLALVTVLIILFFRKARALNYEKNIRRISALKMENVRGHISPHFTFNILNNIWTIIDDRENARFQFDNLMNMIRHSLVNTEKIAIPLAEEIEFVTSYLNLQNFRMDGELDIVWNIDLGVDLTTLVPGMILQIPVENSIKHGLSPKQGTKKLSIGVAIDDGVLIVVITDNGVGYNAKAITSKGTGTGLKVLTNTINLLNQINARKMSYDIQSQNNEGESGTKVTVKIPLNYNFNLS